MQRAINEDFGSRDEGGWLTVEKIEGKLILTHMADY